MLSKKTLLSKLASNGSVSMRFSNPSNSYISTSRTPDHPSLIADALAVASVDSVALSIITTGSVLDRKDAVDLTGGARWVSGLGASFFLLYSCSKDTRSRTP